MDDLAYPAAEQGPSLLIVRCLIRPPELIQLIADVLAHVLDPVGKTLLGTHHPRRGTHHPLDVRQRHPEQAVKRLPLSCLRLPHQLPKPVGLQAAYY
jgi:hypothetical protein